ncbi:hypothetical protein [Herbaspirillum chlorophenolicum]|jgi:hypothetical protein|uniref:hypothetical protein n=1 Tax=Herbaspirillum chlorophenolicum TaxID=211589 RepID=UPI00067DC204|nr:hypothetical protein [Herbaspirillum chlorophenolicum]
MAIDTSLNTLSSLSAYTGSSSLGSSTGSASGANAGGTVAAVDNPAAVQQAVELAADASVIVSLGNSNSSSTDGLIYNAAGVFNSIVDAGTAQNAPSDTTQNQATQSLDQGILSGIASPPTAAGIYNGSGEFTGLDTGLTSQLSALLKSNPDMTDSIVSDLVTQGIVGSLFSTTA